MSYNGWMIPDDERERLLALYPPRFPIVKASHITHEIDPLDTFPVDAKIEIAARVFDEGLEAFVVRVNGNMIRPDGQIYHLTYSMVEGRASKESNDVIAGVLTGVIETAPEIMHVPEIETRAFFCPGDKPYWTTPLTGLGETK